MDPVDNLTVAECAVVAHHREMGETPSFASALMKGYDQIKSLEGLDDVYRKLEDAGYVEQTDEWISIVAEDTGARFIRHLRRLKKPE